MNYRLSLLVAIFLVFFNSPPLIAAHGGGGGHSGGGSHGGGHAGGRSSGGGSSGHSFGHSVGHSLGHIFGHHSGRHDARSGENSSTRTFKAARPLPVTHIHMRPRRTMFHGNRLFNSGFCDSLRFSWRNLFFAKDIDCFGGSFFFDPFFYGESLSTYFRSDSFTDTGGSADSSGPTDTVKDDLPAPTEEPGAAAPLPSDVREPVVLLQLLDGSMYGLTRYWLEGTDLHYVTTYGGENSVPLVRVDFAKTMQLNAERGTRFDLTRNFPNP